MKNFKRALIIMICMFLLFNSNIIVFAEEKVKDEKAFEQMADEYMKKALDDYKVAGVTVSVVKDGRVFFKKGYGYADLEKKVPVDPDNTKFEIGSTTKLFTATAMMQLVEQGKIELDEDITKYLGEVKIKNKFSTPITLRNLLTHTAGFDEDYLNVAGKENDPLKPLEDSLKKYTPEVIRRPGTCIQYSNHGYALIGYLVEKISGVPFDKYVTDNIINKLNMKSTIYFRNKDTSNISKPYKYDNGKFEIDEYTNVATHPAGSICSTAEDMTNFMIMHLGNGEYNRNRILKEDTAIKMHSTAFTVDKNLLGYTLGFYENFRNGHKTIEHGGDTFNFHTQLTILPEKKIGLFLSCNTSSANVNKIREEFANKFYEFFTEKGEASIQTFNENKITNAIDINKLQGSYKVARYPHNEIFKFTSLIPMNQIKVKVEKSGEIVLNLSNRIINKGGSGNSDVVFKNVSDSLFYSSDINKYVKFIEKDKDVFMILGIMGAVQSFEKVSNIDTYLFYLVVFGVLVSAIGVIIALVSLIRKKYRACSKEAFVSKILLLVVSLLLISYIVFNGLIIKNMSSNNISLAVANALVIRILASIIGLFAIIFNANNIIIWKNKIFSVKTRVLYSLLGIIVIVNVVFMYITNVFKF